MPIKPIKTEADYELALKRVEALWGSPQGTADGDELDVLASLIEAYECEHYPIDFPDPIDAIKFRLEQTGKDYQALIGIIGQRTRVYEVIRRARPLSLNMIRKLNQKLEIPAEVLIRPVRKTRSGEKRHRVIRRSQGRNGLRTSTDLQVQPDIDQLLRTAISLRRQIRFSYDGKERISEPHDYGIQKGHVRLLTYQVGGHSTGLLPGWRWIEVPKMLKLEILAQPFRGRRAVPSGEHHEWDKLFIRVQAA